jgi:hypothetical protein
MSEIKMNIFKKNSANILYLVPINVYSHIYIDPSS